MVVLPVVLLMPLLVLVVVVVPQRQMLLPLGQPTTPTRPLLAVLP